MANKKNAKPEVKKAVEVKPKGPKVDYTPKNGNPKKNKIVEKPAVVYYGESTFTVTEEGATCSWNEASRQLCLHAAQEMISGYKEAARPALFKFAQNASLIENAKELTNAEYLYFGGQVTMGSHMKRQRFWKFVGYIGNGRIPSDLSLYTGDTTDHVTAEKRAVAMVEMSNDIKKKAAEMVSLGQFKETEMFRVSCLLISCVHWPDFTTNFEAAPHNYTPEMKGYKSLKDWAFRP
jgi:hypothetical protein